MPISDNTQKNKEGLYSEVSLEESVIDETYAVTVDPLRYDDLMGAWRRYLELQTTCRVEQNVDSPLAIPALETHFKRAIDIFQRIGRRQQQDNAEAQLAKLPMFAVLLAENGAVVASNQMALTARPSPDPKRHLSDLGFPAHVILQLENWMARRNFERQPVIILPIAREQSQRSSFLICAPYPRDLSNAGKRFLLTTIDLNYDDGLRALLKQTFRLTNAEIEVAVSLAQGLSPAVISESRRVSLETVRTQIKGALEKVGTNAAADLVRILTGLAASHSVCQLLGGISEEPQLHQPNRRSGELTLPDGRRLAYEQSGDEAGRPLLFLHDMMHAPSLTDAALEAAQRWNWRLIAPSRPGFGASNDLANISGLRRLDATCADLRRLLQHLEIDRITVVGHMSGGLTAIRLAALAPEQVQGVALVSCVPNWRHANLAHLPFRVGLLARTTLVAPQALTLLARVGAACVDAGHEDRVIDMFHSDMPVDKLALRRPEVRQIVAEGLRHGVRQGISAFCQECQLVLRDWTSQARQIRQPMHLLHGAHDISCRTVDARRFVEATRNATLTTIEDAGVNLLYTHWPKVFEAAHSLEAQAASNAAAC